MEETEIQAMGIYCIYFASAYMHAFVYINICCIGPLIIDAHPCYEISSAVRWPGAVGLPLGFEGIASGSGQTWVFGMSLGLGGPGSPVKAGPVWDC